MADAGPSGAMAEAAEVAEVAEATAACPPAAARRLRVEFCAALPDRACRITLDLPEGALLRDAVEAALPRLPKDWLAAGLAPSGASRQPDGASRHAGHASSRSVAPMEFGVFGQVRSPDWPLRDGDRVELYRPLTVDPNVARRRRVETRRLQQGRSKWRPMA